MQMHYHEIVNNSPQWNASFCYPEGFMRWWAQASRGGNFQLTMTPYQVQFMSGIADNFVRQVLIGQQHVQKVPQWYGETVGFWDGDTLVAWTANVQGWIAAHDVRVQRPARDRGDLQAEDGRGKFIGLDDEAILYDPEVWCSRARLRPLHPAARRTARPTDSPTSVPDQRQERGRRPQQLDEADPRFVDYYGRPWAKVWEKYFENGWDKPEEDELPADISEMLK